MRAVMRDAKWQRECETGREMKRRRGKYVYGVKGVFVAIVLERYERKGARDAATFGDLVPRA